MSLSPEAERILEFIESADVFVRVVNTHDRGDVAQVVNGREGLYVAPVTAIDELLAAGRIEAHETRTAHYVLVDGKEVRVEPTDVLATLAGETVTPVAKNSATVYQKKTR